MTQPPSKRNRSAALLHFVARSILAGIVALAILAVLIVGGAQVGVQFDDVGLLVVILGCSWGVHRVMREWIERPLWCR